MCMVVMGSTSERGQLSEMCELSPPFLPLTKNYNSNKETRGVLRVFKDLTDSELCPKGCVMGASQQVRQVAEPQVLYANLHS